MTRFALAPLGALLFLTAGCNSLFECGRGSERETQMVATVSDTSGSISVDAWLTLGENRGNSNPARQVAVNVQSVQAPVPPPAPAALVGHVTGARFELADGTPIYEMSLMTPQSGPGQVVVAINFTNDMSAADFTTLRDHLLRDSVYVVLLTDASAPVMRRTLLHAFQITDWRTIACS